jgi:membrane protein
MARKPFLARLWTRINDHDVLGNAAQLSYYFLLALFPLLLFLVTLLGYFAEAGSALRESLIGYLSTVMPRSAVDLVHTTLNEISNARGGGKLSFGLIAALWAASTGVTAISQTLNVAYGLKETRSWWKAKLISILLTIVLAFLIVSALTILFYGGKISSMIAARLNLGEAGKIIWAIVQWVVALFFLLASVSLTYRFAPDIPHEKRRWITPGAVVAVLLWILICLAFRVYLHYFDSYSLTYGSLGAVIILMLWFYLSGVAILMGGEINSELQDHASKIEPV